MEENSPNPYKALYFLVNHGDTGVLVVTVVVLLLGLLGVMMTGALWAIPIVVVGDALLYLIARSYVEMVRVIVDMLLPK